MIMRLPFVSASTSHDPRTARACARAHGPRLPCLRPKRSRALWPSETQRASRTSPRPAPSPQPLKPGRREEGERRGGGGLTAAGLSWSPEMWALLNSGLGGCLLVPVLKPVAEIEHKVTPSPPATQMEAGSTARSTCYKAYKGYRPTLLTAKQYKHRYPATNRCAQRGHILPRCHRTSQNSWFRLKFSRLPQAETPHLSHNPAPSPPPKKMEKTGGLGGRGRSVGVIGSNVVIQRFNTLV